MKNSYKYLIVLLAGIAFVLNSCKKECPCDDPTDPTCDNYDPCYGKKPITADFEMGYILRVAPHHRGYVEEFQPDYAFERVNIGFRPQNYDPNDGITYTWLLGSEVIEEAEFYRDFSSTTEDEIPVTLIVEGKPNLDCFPLDDGRDTLTKMIKLIDGVCNTAASGRFRVKFDGYSDSATVSVLNWGRNGGVGSMPFIPDDTCSNFGGQFVGFDPEKRSGSDTLWEIPSFYRSNSKHLYNNPYQDYTIANGSFEVKADGTAIAEYDIKVPIDKDPQTGTTYNDVRVKFKGRKIR